MNQISSDNGMIRLYDGTIVYIEEILYSADGQTNWEESFNPNEHINTITGIGTLPGHRYRKVRHAGDTNYQIPEYIVAEDGKNIELQVSGEYIQWRVVGGTTWTNLVLLDSIKGAPGEQGVPGAGVTIDRCGAFDNKPNCSTTTVTGTTLGCGCTGTSVGTSGLTTFLSLGNHILNDTEDTGYYFANEADLPTFSLYNSAADAGKTAKYWHGTNASGLGAYTYLGINLAQGVSGGTDTTGNLYTCVDGQYILINSIAANDHRIAETTGSTNIGYLDNFVTNYGSATITGTGTIGIDGGKLEIIDESVTTDKFEPNVFNDGLTNTGTEIDVNPGDIVGYGTRAYTSTGNTYENIQVYVQDIISDGITYENLTTVDGETRDKILVDVDNIISPTTGTDFTGLETSTERGVTETDGYENIYVKEGDCLLNDAGGVNVVADELSINALNRTSLRIKPYASGNDGVLPAHFNPTVVHTLGGLALDTSSRGLKANIYAEFPITITTGYFDIKDNGIEGEHLNDNTCDNTKGIEVLNDKLAVKVDGTSIQFNGSGELELVTASTTANASETAIWGQIDGTLSNQTDLMTVLNLKVDENTTYSNMYISNGNSIPAGMYIKLGTTVYGARLMSDDNGNLYLDVPNKRSLF